MTLYTWTDTFRWVVPVYEGSDSDSATTTTGLLCSLCHHHRTHQRNKSGTWAEKACTYLHKDVLERHEKSAMHTVLVTKMFKSVNRFSLTIESY